ncbi:MAG: GFA family protein [Alphaproteobacteria bacterium]|nr:MAG: GFA family protein [Alphaproteobacteria bacterium]TMJ35676.1 MAG: GFA family protein [Alphaproteobacteria bacterium]
MTEARNLGGGCACGAVRYRLKTPPMFVNCCHCRDCQRETGSAFVINGVIEADRIEMLKGNPEPVSMPTDSGRPHDIYRCPDCRIALWSDYGRRPIRFVRVSTLDEAAAFKPDAHIFTRSKLPWVRLPEDAPAFEVYYEMNKLWPAESLKRREALLGPGK